MSSHTINFEYKSEIDGLRAIAVLAVILFHLEFNLLSGGFLGVDIFFVISGYLITQLLAFEYEKKSKINCFYQFLSKK